MSNTIVILSNAYEEYNSKIRQRKNSNITTLLKNNSIKNKSIQIWEHIKSNKSLFVTFFILVVSTAVFLISVIKEESPFIVVPSIISYVVSMFLLTSISEKNDIKNYKKIRRDYDKKLKGFMHVLKYEFKLDSKEKIEYMLKECDETIKELTININLLSKFLDSWKSMFFPIITLGLGYILKIDTIEKSISWQTMFKGMILAILFLLMVIGVLYAIQQIIDTYSNSYKNRINRLKRVLIDIYLKYYA